VHSNEGLSGAVPASLGNWGQIRFFRVSGNRFSGALPAMSFSTMTWGVRCILLDDPATNSFACPWPAGAKDVCQKYEGGWVPITDDDCHGTAPPTPPPSLRGVASLE
jgi:hypothetical protein